MARTVKDRVKKYRAKKSVTAEGVEEMRAKNRLYAKRSRAKKILKKLQEDLAKIKPETTSVISVDNLKEIHRCTNQYKESLIEIAYQGKTFTSDEKIDVETKIIKYEISMLRKMSKGLKSNDLMQRQNSAPARLETLPPNQNNEHKIVSPKCSASSQESKDVETEEDALDRIGKSINQQLQRQYTAPVIPASHIDRELMSSDPFIPLSHHPDVGVEPNAPDILAPVNNLDLTSLNSLQCEGLPSEEEMIAALSSELDLSPITSNDDNFLDELELGGDLDCLHDPLLYSLGL